MTKDTKSAVATDARFDLMTTEDAAKFLKTKAATLCVWRSTARNTLPYVKIGGAVRYRRCDLEKFILDNLHSGGGPEPAAQQEKASSSPALLPAIDLKSIPEGGFIRQAELIGEKPVSSAECESNREAGWRVVRPRQGREGLIPFSNATLWRKVKLGEFPAPVKLSDRVTAWRVKDVRAWIEAKKAA